MDIPIKWDRLRQIYIDSLEISIPKKTGSLESLGLRKLPLISYDVEGNTVMVAI